MKKVIITGVSEGLGYEVAKKLLNKGVQVVGLSRNKPDLDIVHYEVDFNTEGNLENIVQKIKHEHPIFDAIINCAGVMSLEDIDAISNSELKRVFEVNVFAPVVLVSGLAQEIRKNEADIVNVASTAGLKANKNECTYGASKYALRGVTENFQLEFKGTKTRVIGFYPGGFKTGFFEKATGIPKDMSEFMETKDVATALIQTLELPKNMEVSSIVINRK